MKTIIWFNIKKLEQDLIEEKISERQGLYYLLGLFIIGSLGDFSSPHTYDNSWLIVIEVLISIIITVVALKKTFDLNKMGTDKHYFTRLFSLSFVNFIRFLALLAIPIMLFAVITLIFSFEKDVIKIQGIYSIGLGILFQLVYFNMLVNSFSRINRMEFAGISQSAL